MKELAGRLTPVTSSAMWVGRSSNFTGMITSFTEPDALLIPVALAAPLAFPDDVKVIGQDQWVDNQSEVLNKDITVTKKTLTLREASGEEGLDNYIPAKADITTEFTYNGGTYDVTVNFLGYNGCRANGSTKAICTVGLQQQIQNNIRFAKESIDGQVKPPDVSNEISIEDLDIIK